MIDKKDEKSFVFRKTKEEIRLFSPYLIDESVVLYDYGSIVESNNPEKDNPFLVVYKLKQ